MVIYFLLFPMIAMIYLMTLLLRQKAQIQKTIFCVLTFGTLGFISASRASSVGTDVTLYENIFKSINYGMSAENNLGYVIYNKLIGNVFGYTGHEITAANSVLITILIGFFIWKVAEHYFVATFLYISLFYYATSFNISRQFIAMGLVLVAISFALDKKVMPWFILTVLATLFHATAIVAFPVYWLTKVHWDAKKTLSIFPITIFASFIFDAISNIFVRFFPHYEMYITGTQFNIADQGQGRVVLVKVFILFILLGLLLLYQKRYGLISERHHNIIALTTVGLSIGIVFYNNILLNRVELFYSILSIVFIPIAIDYISLKFKEKDTVRLMLTIGILLITLVPYYIQVSGNYSGILPYTMNK
ncbi:EpsG family protein [Levilactobacillus brevis]|uniref:EpsG family protein n=1 Tax=Levilactobacillus brevis TaxID=1580 RepID=UPI001BAA3CEE|nr:EpsG family protein [Levilactobacillus brevis]MBS1014260.1 EpsG family protein [Levilactobacillus brevis]